MGVRSLSAQQYPPAADICPSLQPQTGAETWAASCCHKCSWLWLLASLGKEKPRGGRLLNSLLLLQHTRIRGMARPFLLTGPSVLLRGGVTGVTRTLDTKAPYSQCTRLPNSTQTRGRVWGETRYQQSSVPLLVRENVWVHFKGYMQNRQLSQAW